ncbi:hypothetical protein D9M71_491560 [compost metagenome]
MGGAQVARQAGLVRAEAVVLAGDHHHAGVEVLYRVVGAVVAVAHLHGPGAGGQGQQLVAEADAEYRNLGLQHVLDSLDGVVARLGIARTVGQEHAVRLQRQHFAGRSLRRHHGHAAAAGHQHAQDVQLDAIVEGNHVVRQVSSVDGRVAVGFQLPHTGAPLVTFLGGDDLGQVHALQAREATGSGDGRFFADVVTRQNAAVLGALFTQDSGQATGVDAGDGNDIVGLEVLRQRLGVTPVAGQQRQVTDDQASRPDAVRLGIFRGSTGVADVRVGQGNDLLRVGRVCKDFLVAGHSGVEYHLTNGLTVGTDSFTAENTAVGKGEYGWLSQEDLP